MGQTCQCQSKRFEPEIINLGYEVNAETIQQQPETVNGEQKSECQENYDQTVSRDKNVIIPPPPDPIQLVDYSWEKNKPDITYAKPLTQQEEIDFKLEDKVQAQFRRTKNLTIKTTSENYRKIPRDPTPYLILENNNVYVGQWACGKPFGVGCLYMKKNNNKIYEEMYQGQVENAIPHGYGQFIWKDGTKYEGDFVNGVIEGVGRIKRPDHFKYDGQWKSNLPHGKGNESIPEKYIYSGEYFEGMKHGKGKFTWFIRIKGKTREFKEESYEGEFKNNLFDGQGGYYWLDGRKYDGSWKAGKMEGEGVFEWADKRKYVGFYFNDLKHGEGEFTWPDGKRIKGNWIAGKLDGICELFVGKHSYKAEYENGARLRWIKDGTYNSIIKYQDDQRLSQISQNEGSRISLGIPFEINQMFQDKELSLIRQNDQLGGKQVSINQEIQKLESQPNKINQKNSENQLQIEKIQPESKQSSNIKIPIIDQNSGPKGQQQDDQISQEEPKSKQPLNSKISNNNLSVNIDQKSIQDNKQPSLNSLQKNDEKENKSIFQQNNQQSEGVN